MKIYNELEEVNSQQFEILYFELTKNIISIDDIILYKEIKLKKGYTKEVKLGIIRFSILEN